MLMLLEEIVLFRQNRKEAKEKRIKEEKERERMRIKEEKEIRERIKEEEKLKKERMEESDLRMEAIEQIRDEFIIKEGFGSYPLNEESKIHYQDAKQYLLRNGFNWSDLKRMNKHKIFFEASSIFEYKANEEHVLINPALMLFASNKQDFSEEIERKISNKVEKLKKEKDDLK